MFYIYVIKDPASDAIYIGFSADPKQRIRQHQTSAHKGWKLVYYEAYLDEKDARKRERKLKHYGSSLSNLKARIPGSIMAAGHEWAGSQ